MTGVMCALAGAGGDIINQPDLGLIHTIADPGDASTAFQLLNTGIYEGLEGVGVAYTGSWVTPNFSAANYECFATLNSGALSSGTTGAWLSLGTSRAWTRLRTTLRTSSASITIQIREISTGIVKDTGTVTFEATVEI